MIYVILDNLSAHRAKKVRAWCAKNNVELCYGRQRGNPPAILGEPFGTTGVSFHATSKRANVCDQGT